MMSPPTAEQTIAPPLVAQRPPLARQRRGSGSGAPNGVRRRQSTVDGSAATTLSRADALRAFLVCVADEINGLVDAFRAQPLEEQRFASFKTVWKDRRLSALFHVEFWDSTPTDTHHAVLQVTLELLVDAVQKAMGNGEHNYDIVRLLGHIFALYCAFSVQVSNPKIKIAVDPSTWHNLTQLSGLLTHPVTSVGHDIAIREAIAMLRRLEHQESAFLKCLGGCVREFHLTMCRSRNVPIISREIEAGVPDEQIEEKQDMILRLEAMSIQYNAALKALAEGDMKPDGSVSAAASNKRRDRAVPSFLRKHRPVKSTENSGGVEVTALWSDSRVSMSDEWLSRLRQSVDPQARESTLGNGDTSPGTALVESVDGSSDNANILFRNDTTSEVDTALLALEQELERHENVIQQQRRVDVTRTPIERSPRQQQIADRRLLIPQPAIRSIRALSVASVGQESDGLDELEAELVQGFAMSQPTRERRPVAKGTPVPINRKPLPPTELHVKAPVHKTAPLVRPGRAISTVSSAYDSDGLDDLEAELSRGPAIPTRTTKQGGGSNGAQQSIPARQRLLSVLTVGSESDGLADLEAELELGEEKASGPQVQLSRLRPTATRWTRSRGGSLLSSGHESDGLEDLTRELEIEPQPQKHSRKSRLQRQCVRSVTQTPLESSVKRSSTEQSTILNRSATEGSVSRRISHGTSTDELDSLQRELDVAPQRDSTSRQRASRKRPAPSGTVSVARQRKQLRPTMTSSMPVRRSRRLSIASSVSTESDAELAALEAELQVAPTSLVQPVARESTSPRAATTRKRPRSLSIASALTETDDELRQLEAELATTPHSTQKAPIASTKTPKARPRTKQSRTNTQQKKTVAKKTPPKPRKPRQPKRVEVQRQPVSQLIAPSPQASSRAKTTAPSPRRSIASSYDSDGLDELEKELQAFK